MQNISKIHFLNSFLLFVRFTSIDVILLCFYSVATATSRLVFYSAIQLYLTVWKLGESVLTISVSSFADGARTSLWFLSWAPRNWFLYKHIKKLQLVSGIRCTLTTDFLWTEYPWTYFGDCYFNTTSKKFFQLIFSEPKQVSAFPQTAHGTDRPMQLTQLPIIRNENMASSKCHPQPGENHLQGGTFSDVETATEEIPLQTLEVPVGILMTPSCMSAELGEDNLDSEMNVKEFIVSVDYIFASPGDVCDDKDSNFCAGKNDVMSDVFIRRIPGRPPNSVSVNVRAVSRASAVTKAIKWVQKNLKNAAINTGKFRVIRRGNVYVVVFPYHDFS